MTLQTDGWTEGRMGLSQYPCFFFKKHRDNKKISAFQLKKVPYLEGGLWFTGLHMSHNLN